MLFNIFDKVYFMEVFCLKIRYLSLSQDFMAEWKVVDASKEIELNFLRQLL